VSKRLASFCSLAARGSRIRTIGPALRDRALNRCIHLISHRRNSRPVLVTRHEPHGFPVILDSAISTKPRRGTRSLSLASSSGESAANSIFEIPGLLIAICPPYRRSDHRLFANCRPGRKSGFPVRLAHRRCPWLHSCGVGAADAGMHRVGISAAPNRSRLFSIVMQLYGPSENSMDLSCPLICRLRQLVPRRVTLVHVLKVFLIIAHVAMNVARPRRRTLC
jgi:hypothetical protein